MILSWFGRRHHDWYLEGWDTFSGHSYAIPGRYPTEKAARKAAQRRLSDLERTQPTETSGGQDGIQDQVYLCNTGGYRERVLPE